MEPKITVISSLDWPTKVPTTTIVSGSGPSFLEYTAYKFNHISFHHFSAYHQQEREDNAVSNKPTRIARKGHEKTKAAAVDLTTLTPDELDELNYYDILGGIAMHSTPEQIRRSFHKASLKYHPDKQKDSDTNSTANEKKKAGEDPVFLKVKEAFETLSDPAKRKAYDSTVDFDDSIPSASDIKSEKDFYTIFGNCFERNLRFAAENDPDRFKGNNSGGSGGGGKKGKRKNQGKNQDSSSSKQVLLGDGHTPIDEVNRFYDYWVRFESWRDFTLTATKETEHDTDMADSRYEKRWMEKEIARKAKAMKRDEMARISKLVERSLALDPRIRREKEREAREKKEKARLKQEQKEREEREKKEQEEKERKEKQDRELKEKEERARQKAVRDEEKKVLRLARQNFRKLVLSKALDSDTKTWQNMEDMNDDVELLCSKLGAIALDALTDQVSTSEGNDDSNLSVVFTKAKSLKDEEESKRQEEISKRQTMRKEAAKKESAAKAARATKPWTKDELSALAKAVKKYPAGGANRWDAIALFVNNICKAQDPRTKDECIEKYNQLASSSKAGTSNASSKSAPTANNSGKKTDQSPASNSNIWTEEQDQQLQEGLAKYPSSMDKNERWANIAKNVKNKSKKECVQRFKAIREALKKK